LPLERAADELAEQLRRQWKQAAAEQGLISAPIPVQWRWSLRQVTGRIKDAITGRGGKGFPSLPGMTPVTEEQLRSGTLNDLFDVYGGIKSGRLVVLGELGSGKSGAGILLLLAALAHRAALMAEDRKLTPVPVLITPQGWDPTAEAFTDWLAARLARDYPLLRAPEYGKDTALRLIKGDRLAVILDGLDEMPEVLRSVALRALDKQSTFRLVVLARSEELVAAVSNDHLRGAAALELLPINPRQAAEYLTSCQIDARSSRWHDLIEHLREHPGSALAQALSTPLMLTLVRDIYRSEEVLHQLIDVRNGRPGSRETIENYLLDRVLTAAYVQRPSPSPPPYTIIQARRWLGQLARRMKEDGTRNLAWWRIHRWAPAWPRAFVTVGAMSVVSAFIVGPLAGLAIHMHLLAAFRVGSMVALGAVFGKALGFAFMFGLGLLFMSPRDGESPQRGDRRGWSRSDIFMAVPLLLGVGVGVGLERGLVGGLEYRVVGVLMASFVVGVGFVLGGGHSQPLSGLRWDRTANSTNLHAGLMIGVAAGLVVGFGYGLVYGFKYGLAPGLIVGIGYICVIALRGRSSTQQNQSMWSWTDIPATLVVGLCIAIASSAGYGIIYVLIVILSGRSPLQRSRPRWSSITTPTTVLAGLVVGLVIGVVFALTHGLGFAFKGPGLVLGLLFGLTVGLLLGLRQPSTEAASPLDPQSLWRRERRFGLGLGVGLGPVVGLAGGLADWLVFGPRVGLVFGLTGGLVAGLGSGLVSSATWEAALAGAQLRRKGEAPADLLRFLDDARQRQILRTVGPVYQFRDARLGDRLVEASETVPGKELANGPCSRLN
jgi:hypothetical protein